MLGMEKRTEAELAALLEPPRLDPVLGAIGFEPPSKESYQRLLAASEVARRFFSELLEVPDYPHIDDPTSELLDRAQEAIEDHIIALIAASTSNTLESDRWQDELVVLGSGTTKYVSSAWLIGSSMFCGGSEEVVFDSLVSVLSRLGPEAIPSLCYGLGHPEYFVSTGYHLSGLGEEATVAAFPALVAAWRKSLGTGTRFAGTKAWDEPDWERKPRSTPGFSDRTEGDWIELCCRRLGSKCVPYLLETLKRDEQPIVRARVCKGLTASEGYNQPVLSALSYAFQNDAQARVRIAAARAYLRLAPQEDPNTSLAKKLLEDK
jgi:hypothetical protein